ncbi:MFS transporter [Micromonospora sp. HNM0581]|uniref:MFS transporter n=1 Tax=Micromonospora sp. HNM0581 TaxID=2716341 RepID=UPI001469B796|nr:MFS transporter [Micromonospora sp. HNM0581]NLU80788.1 MFS transporter [Micromonospora sp. HNM0581]
MTRTTLTRPDRPGHANGDIRRPLASLYLAATVLSLGRGAWFTCWAMFLTRFAGLSTTEFAIGITVAGVVGLALGGPAGYLADRLGVRETLTVIGAVQGLAVCSFAFTRQFWVLAAITCLVVGAERTAPAIRIALIAGLTSGEQRLNSLATARSLTQSGMVVGALLGALVLSLDNRPAYVSLVFGYGAACFCFTLLLTHVPHVASLRDRKVRRKALAVRDRPFLAICGFNGMLALSWALLDVGLPLWISAHTDAPRWIIGVLIGGNAVAVVALQRRAVRHADRVATAARMGLWSGLALAASCLVFAASYLRSGTVVVAVLAVAAAVHVAGELGFVSSGFGLSVALAPDDAHGEYQGMLGMAQSGALILAPGLLTVLLVDWGVGGWFVLAALFLAGGVGTLRSAAWAQRQHVERIGEGA